METISLKRAGGRVAQKITYTVSALRVTQYVLYLQFKWAAYATTVKKMVIRASFLDDGVFPKRNIMQCSITVTEFLLPNWKIKTSIENIVPYSDGST